MKNQVIMPKLGLTMDEGTVVEWHFKVGDIVTKGVDLLNIQTDKAIVEVESPFSGTLVEILVKNDETVEVGTQIGTIETT